MVCSFPRLGKFSRDACMCWGSERPKGRLQKTREPLWGEKIKSNEIQLFKPAASEAERIEISEYPGA